MARPCQADAPFGLLGRKLQHSWSPAIHQALGSAPYGLIELEPEELVPFVREGGWKGLNVTIPYKRAVLEAADELSPRVEALGAANTLIRRADGSVLAENTDVFGLTWLLERFCDEQLHQTASSALAGTEVLVLGSGGASRAACMALRDLGATATVISRSGPETYGNLLERHADASLIVNATPVGMYPDCPASPVEDRVLRGLAQLRGVVDLIYNPRRTGLCLAAERLDVPCASGLGMLVAQALRSSELFQGKALDVALIGRIEQDILAQTTNVALIGMPGAGKSSAGTELAKLLGRPFVDLDAAFEERFGISAGRCIEERGEQAFRDLETEVLAEAAARSGIIMACGGGVVTRERNRDLLRQNSLVIMLDRPLEELACEGRPLSQAQGVARLAQERMGLYRSWADRIVACTGSAQGDALFLRDLLMQEGCLR